MIDLSMFYLMLPLIAGIALGYLWRQKKQVDLSKVTFGAIIALIFSMGFGIGSDKELLDSMPLIGVNAIVIMLLAVFFSVVLVKAARRMVKLD